MTTSMSHFSKTVNLKDWWLTKADNNSSGNTLGIAGIESAGQQAARVFVSAPIVESRGLFTLITADGIFVLLKGCINRQKTCENGFSEEVFKHFLIGFPPNWVECAEKCFRQGIGSEATADADLNPELITVTKMGNATVKLKQTLWKDSDCNNRHDHYMDEVQETVTELQDDQNIDTVEERSFEDARCDAQNNNKDKHATICEDGDTCMNTDSHDSNGSFMGEGVRYSLRNRKVPYFDKEGVYKGKHVKNVAKGKSFSKKTSIGTHTSTIPSVASLDNCQNPGMAPLRDKSSKEKVKNLNIAASGGVNDVNHAKNIATSISMSVLGKVQESHRHDDTTPIPQEADKANNFISDHSRGGNPFHSKKRKRSEKTTAQKSMVNTRSLLKKNSEKSGGVGAGGNNIQNQNARSEDANKRTPDHLRSASVNIKKRSTHEESTAEETNVNFSPQHADKLENLSSRRSKKERKQNLSSRRSKKERKQRSILTRTTTDNKNSHGSARPTFRTCTSKARSNSKAAATERERKASQGSMPKLGTRRKLDYDQETTRTPEVENKNPTSQTSVLRTSRSGRLLLPTMEFWRNQLPIYDADRGISGIREGLTVLKVDSKGRKSCTKKSPAKL